MGKEVVIYCTLLQSHKPHKEQSVQVCDATKPNNPSTAWPMNYLLIFHFIFLFNYSVLKLFTGFINAALIAWKLIVINAISNAAMVVITNTVQLIFVR